MKDKYVVVIVTYNRLLLLKECINCILNQSLEVNKIIIINNASTDGTEEYLRTLHSTKFLIINENSNFGGAGGFYKGISIAAKTENDWILVIDDDAMISQNYLKEINKYHNIYKNIKAFSGTVKTDGEIITEHRRRMVVDNRTGELPVPKSEYLNDTFEYDLSTFCGLLISRDLVKIIGLPRLDYFIQYDDTEYCMRINKITKILNVNVAVLNHKTTTIVKSNDYKEKKNWKIYYGIRNKIYSYIMHGHKAIVIDYIIHIIGGGIKDLFNPRISKEVSKYNMLMILRSVNNGIIGKLGKDNRYLPEECKCE